MDLKRIGNGAHYSEVIDYNGILYLSGQVNVNTHEIRSQSKAIFAEIDRLLAENDSDKEHILFVTLYLSDAANFEGMNAECGMRGFPKTSGLLVLVLSLVWLSLASC